jgi:hypothetical protein
VLRNKQGELLGQSGMFPDLESLQKGIVVIRGTGHGARLEDQTPRLPTQAERPIKLW